MEEFENTPVEELDQIEFDSEDFAVEQVVEHEVEETTKEVDYTPFLKTISEKAKFNHEPVNVESLDDVITNFQKGLNYDKLKTQLDEISSSEELSYLKEKAEENGMTTKEFIKLVKEQEKAQKDAEYERQYNELLDSGISEELVKELVENSRKAKELEREMNKLKLQEQEKAQESAKNQKYEEFLKAYPDVKVDELPKEVVLANDIKTAYVEYQNKELLKQIEILKQNQEIAKKNPVRGVSEHGGTTVSQKSNDPFLMGFDSE